EKPVSDFINCVAWNHTAKFISNWIKKGTLFTASGRIQTRNYKGADGKTVYITEMLCENIEQQFAASKKEDTYVDYDGQVPNYNENDFVIEGFDAGPTLDIESDDLPF
ncbi:MAG: single-stranded DNA-binding protein, partial [Longicatena sp.]